MSKKKHQNKSGRISQRALDKVVGAGPIETVHPGEVRRSSELGAPREGRGAPEGLSDKFGPEKPPEQKFAGKDIPEIEIKPGTIGRLDEVDNRRMDKPVHGEHGTEKREQIEKPITLAEDLIQKILKAAPETNVKPVKEQLSAATISLKAATTPAAAAAAHAAIQGIIRNLQQTLQNIQIAVEQDIRNKLALGQKP